MITTRLAILSVISLLLPSHLFAQSQAREARIETLEQQLLAAQARVAELEAVVSTLVTEVTALKEQDAEALADVESARGDVSDPDSYTDRILVADLGHDEREEEMSPRPELFMQSRYHANPIDEASEDDVTRNFGLNRMELRWAGRVSDHVGMGYEIQYHPAPDGAAEELVNDAYVEYYPSKAVTLRVGQFVKPFGFDIQHSSSVRESPERGIFAGYFFPGQRDRGAMISADLDGRAPWSNGVSVHAGIFNGNRFFNDNNKELNYNFRVRKVFDSLPLAIGASVQLGTQVAPPGIAGDADEDVYGVDMQYVVGRLGVRAEYVRGDIPSTLLSLEPEFAPAFAPGLKAAGATAFFNFNLTANDDIYWRWDRLTNDPVTGNDISAFNLGYLRRIGDNSRIGIDYQAKNDVTFNDDELNTKFSITWNMEY
ncbi:MAG TPA: porin [Gammaproteobacteria bacterium]